MGAGGGGEDGAGDGADESGDAGGSDLGAEEVFSFILLHSHPVALSGFLEGFVGPDLSVEDGIGMENIDADAEGGEFESGNAGELGHSGLGDGVGGSAWTGGGVVA